MQTCSRSSLFSAGKFDARLIFLRHSFLEYYVYCNPSRLRSRASKMWDVQHVPNPYVQNSTYEFGTVQHSFRIHGAIMDELLLLPYLVFLREEILQYIQFYANQEKQPALQTAIATDLFSNYCLG